MMPLAPAAILDRADDGVVRLVPEAVVQEQRHVLRRRRLGRDGELHRFVDERGVHPDFFGPLVLPVEAFGEIGAARFATMPRCGYVGEIIGVLGCLRRLCASAGAISSAARMIGSARFNMTELLAKLQ